MNGSTVLMHPFELSQAVPKLCGKGRVDFLMSLARVGVPASNLGPEEVDADVAFGLDG